MFATLFTACALTTPFPASASGNGTGKPSLESLRSGGVITFHEPFRASLRAVTRTRDADGKLKVESFDFEIPAGATFAFSGPVGEIQQAWRSGNFLNLKYPECPPGFPPHPSASNRRPELPVKQQPDPEVRTKYAEGKCSVEITDFSGRRNRFELPEGARFLANPKPPRGSAPLPAGGDESQSSDRAE